MSQNPNDPNYNPYGPNPSYPNYPGPPAPGTAYGGQPQPSSSDPQTPNSNYGSGSFNNPYAPPPPPTPGMPNPYGSSPAMPLPPNSNLYDPYAPTVMSQQQAPSPMYPGYNPLPGTMGTLPPPPRPEAPQQRRGRGGAILLTVIALLVVLGGVGGFLVYSHNNAATSASATATANSNATATTEAQANNGATATAVASTYPFSNKVVLNDPLANNSKGAGWDNDGQFCFFSGSAYHVFDNQANTYNTCAALNSNFTNFTFQVEMLVKQGDDNSGGGLIFRANEANSQFYRLYIDQQGNYGILVSVDTTGSNGNARVLTTGTASQFNLGLDQTNTIGVVVRDNQISFYVNQQKITTVTDNTYTHGQIGVTADDQTSNTEIVYSNAEVWGL